ncbi:MAG: PAS domain-containing sensor histidine kinase [Gammaproteobacteria bacterium]|nr:PAS domain-containing sensor histidine kinase [Gammaproteobacteria bacterium]
MVSVTTGLPLHNFNFRQHGLLKVYAYYRALIALTLLGLFISGISKGVAGTEIPSLYFYTIILYASINCAWPLILHRDGYTTTAFQIGTILGCDIVAFLLMIQASGGLNSGLGYLMLITCSAGSMLLDRRMSAFLASVASCAVIAQQVYGLLIGHGDTQDVFSAGSLGILLFVSVITLQYLSERIRTATRRAEHQSLQAAHLQRLAQQIVAQMRTGILVLDTNGKPELVNHAAQQLLGTQWLPDGPKSPHLQQALQLFLQRHQNHNCLLQVGHSELRANVTTLPWDHGDSTLIFIEDNRKLAQQAQQLKLASLGRLTGSIAHEIRNPLAAISHAAQLLSESANLSAEDRHFGEIINRHSQRVNQIINNVMQLSRRQPANFEMLDLRDWLKTFLKEFRTEIPNKARILTKMPDCPAMVRFDPQQLGQILTNLCGNALHYSHRCTGVYEVKIIVVCSQKMDSVRLEVHDNGPGIAKEHQDKIFEPFFTTKQSGTGLGLYIARELCEANQATIYYHQSADQHSCFIIEFADPQQVF